MTRYCVYTGPTVVREIAEGFRCVPGVSNVIDGTERVIFDFEGDRKALEVCVYLSTSYRVIKSFAPSIKKMT